MTRQSFDPSWIIDVDPLDEDIDVVINVERCRILIRRSPQKGAHE